MKTNKDLIIEPNVAENMFHASDIVLPVFILK